MRRRLDPIGAAAVNSRPHQFAKLLNAFVRTRRIGSRAAQPVQRGGYSSADWNRNPKSRLQVAEVGIDSGLGAEKRHIECLRFN